MSEISDFNIAKEDSSLISRVMYNWDAHEIYFEFRTWLAPITYIDVPTEVFYGFTNSKSFGKFYIENIKKHYQTKKLDNMAKKSDMIIKLRIDVTKLTKEWFFKGSKGTYADLTLFYREEQDEYGNNGMVVQSVPTVIYKQDKNVQGPILGNCKNWATERNMEASPSTELETVKPNTLDDLPF